MSIQYDSLKARHIDCVLLFRLGDFYEAFDDDAKILSRILGITLTARGKNENKRPMAGIPYHALDNYLPKLIDQGYKVAIADQLTKAGEADIVERDVVKVYSKGTYTSEKNLKPEENNFIACLHIQNQNKQRIYNLAFLDLSTAELFVLVFDNFKKVIDTISNYDAKELLIAHSYKNIDLQMTSLQKQYLSDEDFSLSKSFSILTRQLKTKNLKGFGFEETDESIVALAVLVRYAKDSQKTELVHITKIKKVETDDYMLLDKATVNSLELVSSIRRSKDELSVFKILNKTMTPMGARLLYRWLLQPLKKRKKIEDRLDAVDSLIKNKKVLDEVLKILSNIYDIARLVAKIGTGHTNARDIISLRSSLRNIQNIHTILKDIEFKSANLQTIIKTIDPKNYRVIIDLVDSTINEDAPVRIEDGGVIKNGYDQNLDKVRNIKNQASEFIKNMQVTQRLETGIESLKIKFNKIFGYYIEITKSNLHKVPDHYIRRQTLVNAERYITPELKEFEAQYLSADEQILNIEIELFQKFIQKLVEFINVLQDLSIAVAELDVYANFAFLALNRGYVKPKYINDNSNFIKNSRHPVIELIKKEEYIPNDIVLDKDHNIVILTGPNMSGKSTYIRQVALCFLLAQIGCFVPCQEASIQVVDRIFTRVGASDNIASGESTFMVEMNETANILNNATENSLIILDEVGRGTSTYDGVSIAWSVVEYIHKSIKAKTLFATHYHELIRLENIYKGIVNLHVDVYENENQIVFSHLIKKGGVNKSYGIHVADMAGVPREVTKRAKKILDDFEHQKNYKQHENMNPRKKIDSQDLQISLLNKIQ